MEVTREYPLESAAKMNFSLVYLNEYLCMGEKKVLEIALPGMLELLIVGWKSISAFFASPNKLSTVGTGNFHALPATTAIVECSVVSSTVPLWEEVSRWTLRVYVANKR